MVKFADRLAGATPCGCPGLVEREPIPALGDWALTAEAVGLYVHVPFCRSKCRYCGFYSIPAAGRDTGRLVGAMLREGPDTGAGHVFALLFGWAFALIWFAPWLLVYAVIQFFRRRHASRNA